MNAIKELYLNAGLVTEDGYVKVNDNLWIQSGPYRERRWSDANYTSYLPTQEELFNIHIKLRELIQIQEACGLESLQQIVDSNSAWVWSDFNVDTHEAYCVDIVDNSYYETYTDTPQWVISVRREL